MAVEDVLIAKYAEKLSDIYNNRTAGEHTFIGVLAQFLWDLNKAKLSGEAKRWQEALETNMVSFATEVKNIGDLPRTHVVYPSGRYILEVTGDRILCRTTTAPGTYLHLATTEEDVREAAELFPQFIYFFGEERV